MKVESITKTSPPANLMDNTSASALVRVYFEFNQLKQLYRQGWLRRGVPPERGESVAEHTFGAALESPELRDILAELEAM